MAFDRLQNLGKEKWTAILNALMRGEPAMGLARKIQQEWGGFVDVKEMTLTQQLNRLRMSAAEGMFGPALAAQIVKHGTPTIKALEKSSLPVLERMEELAGIQRQRLMDLRDKEKAMPVPVGAQLTATNAVFTDYSKVLQDIQKMRFDLGLDEFKGVVQGARVTQATATLPDGTSIQKTVYEAMLTVEDIMNKRGVPKVIDVQP